MIRSAPAYVVLAVLVSQFAVSADPPRAPPPELKQLEPFVGTWKVKEFRAKKAEWSPEEVRHSGSVATTKPILGGCFLEDRKVPNGVDDHVGIWHYDHAEKAFHYTMFQMPGHRSDLTIRWNEATKVFEGSGSLPNGVTMRTSIRFLDKNSKRWTAKATDATGKVYLDMECEEIRMGDADGPAVKGPPAGR